MFCKYGKKLHKKDILLSTNIINTPSRSLFKIKKYHSLLPSLLPFQKIPNKEALDIKKISLSFAHFIF
jgi:hypothetical protein